MMPVSAAATTNWNNNKWVVPTSSANVFTCVDWDTYLSESEWIRNYTQQQLFGSSFRSVVASEDTPDQLDHFPSIVGYPHEGSDCIPPPNEVRLG
jgi:hypothetical protein